MGVPWGSLGSPGSLVVIPWGSLGGFWGSPGPRSITLRDQNECVLHNSHVLVRLWCQSELIAKRGARSGGVIVSIPSFLMTPITFFAAWAPRDVQEDPSGWGDPWGSLGDPLKSVGVLGCSWGGPWGSSGDPLGAPRVLGGLLEDPLGVSWPPEGLKVPPLCDQK